MTNTDVLSISKRKAFHIATDASPFTKRPRWLTISESDVESTEIGGIFTGLHSDGNHTVASDSFGHASSSLVNLDGKEGISDIRRDFSPKDSSSMSIPRSSFKGKAPLYPQTAFLSVNQKKHAFYVDLTQQDADSEDERPSTSFMTNKGSGTGTSQVDAIDLTSEDGIIFIEPSPEPAIVKKPLHSEGSSPTSSFTGQKCNDEPLAYIKSEGTNSRFTIPPDADIIDLSYDEVGPSPGETLVEVEGMLETTALSREASHDTTPDMRRAKTPQRETRSPPPLVSIQMKVDDITMALVDPIAELQIDPDRNMSEDETSEAIIHDDNMSIKREEQQLSSDSSTPHFSSDETFASTPNDEPLAGRAIHVKEPDFSQISAGATEPVPDYNDRLSAAIKWPAEKLSTELHDMINRLPSHYLFNPQMKHIFEAVIEDNTAEDEPLAPKIPIIGRKNGPVTPPWEFYYTNRIVYGEGVPRSDKKLLQGCDCIGPCDPKSKTCACARRQMAWTGGDIKGFLYKKERLSHSQYPVFECNDACECSEECMNRVVQHGRKHRISIVLTKNKGWGVFADEKIPRGTYLGIYSGEIILEAEADERGRLYDRYGRTYLFDVDFYHLRSLDKDTKKGKDEERTSIYTIDAFHVGNFTRFLNHSCDPNCQITATYVNEPDVRKPALTIFTSRDIQKGEEITFAYFGEAEAEEMSGDEELDGKTVKMPGPSPHKQQAIHRKCLCGATSCRGQMF